MNNNPLEGFRLANKHSKIRLELHPERLQKTSKSIDAVGNRFNGIPTYSDLRLGEIQSIEGARSRADPSEAKTPQVSIQDKIFEILTQVGTLDWASVNERILMVL